VTFVQLQAPDGIRLGSETRALLKDVEKERQRLEEMGKFPREVQEELRKAFLPERIADTLAIEGMHINPRVTRSVLEGIALGSTPLDACNERTPDRAAVKARASAGRGQPRQRPARGKREETPERGLFVLRPAQRGHLDGARGLGHS
jgi:hypothetical protein